MAKYVWLALAAILIIGSMTVRGADEITATEQSPEFEDKIVIVMLENSNPLQEGNVGASLKDVVITKIGDRFFLTGNAVLRPDEVAQGGHDWRKDAHYGIELSKVRQFFSYTPTQFEKAFPAEEQEE